jgi:glycosyltransferase involved in cell wall biosynthesis
MIYRCVYLTYSLGVLFMSKISIITVIFNPIKNGRKETLLQAINSVYEQDYVNKEHIIIDGNSSDGTVELLQELKSLGKITHFISEPDTGIYDAMNKGIALATGDYIGFLNSDDYYFDMQAFQKISDKIQGYDYLYSSIKIENTSGVIDGEFTPSKDRFLTRMPFSHQSLIVKKSLFQEFNNFDTSFKMAADYDFIIRMMLNGKKGILLPYALSVFRMGGISNTHIEEGTQDKINVWIKNYGFADYGHYIKKKILPLTILWKLLKHYPKAYKAILHEMYRSVRKECLPISRKRS